MVEKSIAYPLVKKFSKNKKESLTLGFVIMAAILLFYPFKIESFYVIDKEALLAEQIHKNYPKGIAPKEDIIKATKDINASIAKVEKQTGHAIIDSITAKAIKIKKLRLHQP